MKIKKKVVIKTINVFLSTFRSVWKANNSSPYLMIREHFN